MTAVARSRAVRIVALLASLAVAPLPAPATPALRTAHVAMAAPAVRPGPPVGLVPAQSRPDQGSPDAGGDHRSRRYVYFNPRDTGRIDQALRGALATCGPSQLELRYRIDCIRFYFMQLAHELPETGDYAPLQQALAEGAAKLDAIVRRDLDPGAPALRPRVGGRPAAPRTAPIRAVSPAAEARAAREAAAVIEETATILLRSAENSQRRMAHFQQIAAAIGSTKVLLRSG